MQSTRPNECPLRRLARACRVCFGERSRRWAHSEEAHTHARTMEPIALDLRWLQRVASRKRAGSPTFSLETLLAAVLPLSNVSGVARTRGLFSELARLTLAATNGLAHTLSNWFAIDEQLNSRSHQISTTPKQRSSLFRFSLDVFRS